MLNLILLIPINLFYFWYNNQLRYYVSNQLDASHILLLPDFHADLFQRGFHSQGLCTSMCEGASINWKVTLFYTSGFPMNFFLSDKTVSGKPRRDTIW
jgi:hypothetical protein